MVGDFTRQLSRRADAFETFSATGESLRVQFENDRLTEIRQGESSGVGIRAVKQGKIGFSYSSKADEIDDTAEAALRMAPFGKPYAFQFAGEARSPHTRVFDERCSKLDVEKMVRLGTRVREVIKSVAPEAMAECTVGGGVSSSRIVTSNGQECHERESEYGYMVAAKFAEEGNFLSTYRYRGGNQYIGDDEVLAAAREAAEEFRLARTVAPFAAGTCRVLFAPTALSDILMPIGASVNGINIARKTSRFVEAMGQKLFDERLTLLDDPWHEQGPAGGLYDGEGVVTRQRAIIEKGVLKGFLHTLSTAQMCGHQPTGNAARAVSSQPMPGAHNTVMAAGNDALADLYRQAEGGLCISQLLGTFTSNFLAGQVSGNISLGYLVKEGRRVGRVKNCALNVNSFDLLKSRIVGISREREWVGSEYLPWLLVEDVTISAR